MILHFPTASAAAPLRHAGSPYYDDVLAILAGAAAQMSANKNVPLSDEERAYLATMVLDTLPVALLTELTAARPAAILAAAKAVDRGIDAYQAARVLCYASLLRGDAPLEAGKLLTQAQAFVDRRGANDGIASLRWPDLMPLVETCRQTVPVSEPPPMVTVAGLKAQAWIAFKDRDG